MQIKLRKVLAVLSVLAMLCTVLPFSAMVSAASVVVSYDFEDGTSSWGGTVIDGNGGKAIQWAANGYGYLNKKPTMQDNTWYKVTFDHKGDPVNALIWNDSVALAVMQTPTSADWTTYSYVFYSGVHATRHFRFQNPSSSAKTICLDNIKLETLDGTAQYDNYLYDGNFEADAGNWVKLQSGIGVAADPTGAGQGNVMVTNATAQGDMFRQRFYLDAQTDYVLSFKVYGYATSITNSVFYVKFNSKLTYDLAGIEHDGLAGTAQASAYAARLNVNTNTGKWINVSIPFSSNDATATDITIYNYRTTGQYYFDDFKVTKAGEEPSEPETPDAPAGNDTPSNDGYIINGDFETGDANSWSAGTGATVAYNQKYAGNFSMHMTANGGSYAYGLSQTVAVEKNTNYTVSFYYTLVGGTNIRLYICDGDKSATLINPANGGSQPVAYGNSSSAVNGVWKQASVSFNSGENESIFLKIGGGSSGYGECYLDNFVMTKDAVQPEPEEPEVPETGESSFDGYLYNGDFENGTDKWTVSGGEIATIDGDKALKGTTTSRYDTIAEQVITVEANKNYVLTVNTKYVGANSGAMARVHVYKGATGTTEALEGNYYWNIGANAWESYQLSFNPGDNTQVRILIQQHGAPNTSTAVDGNIYFDDLVVTEVKEDVGYQGSYPETMTSGADIRFMTYNVLCGKDEANGGYSWGTDITGRPEKAFAMINYYKPDVIAFEEFSGEWYDAFVAQMTDYVLCEMQSADTSKNNGKLYTCLAYNKNTINLLDTDLFRNTVSRWGTQGMRYVNVGFFEIIATGEKFIGAATHPDAGNLVGDQDLNGDGVAGEGDGYWRQFQLEEAAEYVAGLSEQYKMPVVWGGDFNSGLDGTYDDYTSWYKVADAGFTDATNGRYIDHVWYNGMATHLYETTVADAAVLSASDHKPVFADIQFLDEFATPIKTAKDYIKTQGRTTLKDGAMWVDFSASGIEFSANCEGKVALNLNVKSIKNTDATYGGIYFTVIVDGVKVDRAQCRITSTGNVELVLAENLPAGNHTFEVYRQTEHRGAEVGISSIVMNGTFNQKPEDNRLYIEFIGDSISTGYGVLGITSDSEPNSPLWQDATLAYPYLTAKALGADFSDVCYSGIGAKYGWQDPNMQNFYPYQRWQYDRNTQYNFNARQPDVVVIALGTNDIAMESEKGITVEQRLAGYQEMLDLVRAKNPNSKIVWIYGMMKDADNERIPAIIEENGGAAAGLYSLELVTNTAGAGYHPSKAGQATFAEELVAFLNSDVLVRYVGDEMTDNEGGMDNVYCDPWNTPENEKYHGKTSRTEEATTGSGLAFLFNINATHIATTNGNESDLTNALVDAFGDDVEYKLVRMGAIVTNDPTVGMTDFKLADTGTQAGSRTIDINAKYLWDLSEDCAKFAVRVINIPPEHEKTMIYARAYYVFEYEGREVIVYDEIFAANYIDKYESNDGVLEW